MKRSLRQRAATWAYFFALTITLALAKVGANPRAAAQSPSNNENPAPAAAQVEKPPRLLWQIDSPPFGHRSGARYLAFSPDGRHIASCTSGNRNTRAFLLWDAAKGSLVRRFEPSVTDRGTATSVAISPDGKLLFGGWGLGYGTVWELDTGRELFSQKIHGETVLNCSFMPDSAYIVTCGSDSTIAVTRVADQARVALWSFARSGADSTPSPFSPSGGGSPVAASIDIASDGRILTAHRRNNSSEALVWKVGSQEPILKIERPNSGERGIDRVVESAAFTKDGTQIITAGAHLVPRTATKLTEGPLNVQVLELKTWDAASGQLAAEISDPNVHGFGKVKVSPDGRLLATHDFDGIHLWRIGDTQPIRHLPITGRQNESYDLYFSADGRRLAAVIGNIIRIWNVDTGEVIAGGDSMSLPVTAAAWSRDGRRFAIGSGMRVELWDAQSRTRLADLSSGDAGDLFQRIAGVRGLAFSSEGSSLIVAGNRNEPQNRGEGVIQQWNLATSMRDYEIVIQTRLDSAISKFDITPDGRHALVIDDDARTMAVYDLASKQKVAELPAVRDTGKIRAAQFTQDGRDTWITYESGQTLRWDFASKARENEYTTEWRTAQEQGDPPTRPWVERAAFSPNGRFLITAHRPNSRPTTPSALVIWDNNLRRARHVTVDQRACHLVVSPDNRLVAGFEVSIGVSGHEPTDAIHIWDLATGRELFTLEPQDARATAMAFSPDSQLLLTGFDRGTFAIWDVR